MTTREKTLQINVDATRYGTVAEIGAGQEVARWFFHVGVDHQVAPHLRHLYAHLLDNHLIEPMTGIDDKLLKILAHEVLSQIQTGNPAWETVVPPAAVELIKKRGLFGHNSDVDAEHV
jgi:hypothetical protein